MSEISPELKVTHAIVLSTKLKNVQAIADFLSTMPDTKVIFVKTAIGKLVIVDPAAPRDLGVLERG